MLIWKRAEEHVLLLQVDMWAAGVTLYELATGRLLFPSMDITILRKLVLEGEVIYPAGMPPLLQCFLQVQISMTFAPLFPIQQ